MKDPFLYPGYSRTGTPDDRFPGLTKREYFAGLVLAAMCAHPRLRESIAEEARGDTAEALRISSQGAVMYADALIAELEK